MRVGAAKTASHGMSRRPCIILYMQIRSPQILLRIRANSCSRCRAVSYGTWHNPFTNFIASFWTLSSAWQSRERMGEDAWIAYSRCGRISALLNGRKILEAMAAKDRFREKKHSTGFLVAWATLSSSLNPVFKRSPRSWTELTVWMGCAFGEVRDVKEYATGFEVSPMGRCSLLEGLRINSQSSNHLELASKELWRASYCFRGAMSLFITSSAYNKWSIVRLSVKSVT